MANVGDLVDARYTIVRPIGRGSMADVYEARDENKDRLVAVKIMRRSVSQKPESLRRLQREARVQEMIEHRNVARLYGGGVTADNSPYLVMELLRGHSLRSVIRNEGKVEPFRAASYCWQALQGLTATHAVGVWHRDLKPANLMLEPSPGPVERVILIDFGFAALEGGARLTMQGHVVGSLAYLAPERLLGEVGDERSDLYAIGVILYELLVGHRPFLADNDGDLIELHLDAKPTPPMEADPSLEIPRALEAVVMRALGKTGDSRATSASHMAAELQEAAKTLG